MSHHWCSIVKFFSGSILPLIGAKPSNQRPWPPAVITCWWFPPSQSFTLLGMTICFHSIAYHIPCKKLQRIIKFGQELFDMKPAGTVSAYMMVSLISKITNCALVLKPAVSLPCREGWGRRSASAPSPTPSPATSGRGSSSSARSCST